MSPARHIAFSSVTLVISLYLFEYTPLDRVIQDYFYSFESKHWALSNAPDPMQFIFYDGIKRLLILIGLSLPIIMLCFSRAYWVKVHRQGLITLLFAAVLVPGTVGLLKATTNVACPKQLTVYGGEITYIPILEKYTPLQRPEKRLRCFPAGHASGGFALMALYYLFKNARQKRLGLAGAIALGWAMGLYKMGIGDHFFSHTLTSMLLAWLIINWIVLFQDVQLRETNMLNSTI